MGTRQLIAPVGKRILHSDRIRTTKHRRGRLAARHRDLAEIHLVCLCDGAGGGSSRALIPIRQHWSKRAGLNFTNRGGAAGRLGSASGLSRWRHPLLRRGAKRLRSIGARLRPDVVLLPWFLDGHVDHRHANVLYARACAELEATVLGYEIWSLLEPNAVFDITGHMADKLSLIQNYTSQLRTVDYVRYASGLAKRAGLPSRVAPRCVRRGGSVPGIAQP